MTNDYNNGAWWGWNGGECPVHPESNIIYVYQSIATAKTGRCHITEDIAANVSWGAAIAFRVIKDHREPREFWISNGNCAWPTFDEAEAASDIGAEIIHVQEKTP